VLRAASRFDSAVQVWLTGYEMVGAVLGLFVASQTYRGYRRNESPPMLLLSPVFDTPPDRTKPAPEITTWLYK